MATKCEKRQTMDVNDRRGNGQMRAANALGGVFLNRSQKAAAETTRRDRQQRYYNKTRLNFARTRKCRTNRVQGDDVRNRLFKTGGKIVARSVGKPTRTTRARAGKVPERRSSRTPRYRIRTKTTRRFYCRETRCESPIAVHEKIKTCARGTYALFE